MNLNHLTDNELIDYVIKHDDDPIRVRLATHMQRVSGEIISGLEDAGMDDTWCTFESVVNCNQYHPGQYIRHLEDEIQHLEFMLEQERKEIQSLKARTIMDLIVELKQEIRTAEFVRDEAVRDRRYAEENEAKMKSKLDMWAILNR
jgi:hypothetical protein